MEEQIEQEEQITDLEATKNAIRLGRILPLSESD